MKPDSPVITSSFRNKPFIHTKSVSKAVRAALRKAGFPWRPYVLRSYFDTQLMLAESKGLVLRDYRQRWMGHKGDIETTYTLGKQKLPPHVIEDMREAYRRSQSYLQTTQPAQNGDMGRMTKRLLMLMGFSPEEIEELDLENMTDEEVTELAEQRADRNHLPKQRKVTMKDKRSCQWRRWVHTLAGAGGSWPNCRTVRRC